MLLESHTGPGPFAGKAIGEMSNVPPPAAIANAVCDALAGFGVEINETPLRPARLVRALRTV